MSERGYKLKWKPEYVDLLRKHLTGGNSFMSFDGKVKVGGQTLYSWVRNHPEFRKVKEELAPPKRKRI